MCYSVEAAYQFNLAFLLGHIDQALEMLNPNLRPEQVKQMGSKLRRNLTPEEQYWLQEIKPHVMRPLIYQKFSIGWLRTILLDTGSARLVEAGTADRYWGVGLSAEQIEARHSIPYDALNWMGRLLEEVRNYFGQDILPVRYTMIIGDNTMSVFGEDTVKRNNMTLLCRPGASLTYLLTLAEACSCPVIRNIIVGGGYQELLPPLFEDQCVPTARAMACAVADTVGRFQYLHSHVTYVPPIPQRYTPMEMIEKLAQYYFELTTVLPRPLERDMKTISFLDMSHLDSAYEGPIYEEPKLPKEGYSVIITFLNAYHNFLVTPPELPGDPNKENQGPPGHMGNLTCGCTTQWWCSNCFKQSRR